MSAEQLGHAAPQKRYVIYSDARGVYVGGGTWAKDEVAKTKTNAPTFTEETVLQSVHDGVSDARLVEVFPTLPGHFASKEDLRTVLLPTW